MVETQTTTDRTPPRRSKSTRDRVTNGIRQARDTVKTRTDNATRASADVFDANPFSALAGAIAVGAVAAAFIPTTRRELETLGPWAENMRQALADAFEAAKDAGTGELTAAGLSFTAASEGLGGVVGKIVKAATTATVAATKSVNQSRKQSDTEIEPAVLDN